MPRLPQACFIGRLTGPPLPSCSIAFPLHSLVPVSHAPRVTRSRGLSAMHCNEQKALQLNETSMAEVVKVLLYFCRVVMLRGSFRIPSGKGGAPKFRARWSEESRHASVHLSHNCSQVARMSASGRLDVSAPVRASKTAGTSAPLSSSLLEFLQNESSTSIVIYRWRGAFR